MSDWAGKLQVQPCPQCPVRDGRPEKGGLSSRGPLADSCTAKAFTTSFAEFAQHADDPQPYYRIVGL